MAKKKGKGAGSGGGDARKREKILQQWEVLFEEALALVDDGAPDEAVDLLRDADSLIGAIGPKDEGRLGATRVELAEALLQLERDDEAADAASAAIPALAAALEDDDDEFAELLVRVGHVQTIAGRHSDAVDAFERALGIRARALGADHPTSGPILAGMAAAYMGLGDKDRSESLGDQAVERSAGLSDERQAMVLGGLMDAVEAGADPARLLHRLEIVRDRIREDYARPVEGLAPPEYAEEIDFDAAENMIRRRAFHEAGVPPPSLLVLGRMRAEVLAMLDRRDEAVAELEALEERLAARDRWATEFVAGLEDELGDDEDDDDLEDEDYDDEVDDDEDDDDLDAEDDLDDEEDDDEDDDEDADDEEFDELGEDDEEDEDEDGEHVHGEGCGCGADDPFLASVLILHGRLLREIGERRGEKASVERALELLDRAATLIDSEDPDVENLEEEREKARKALG